MREKMDRKISRSSNVLCVDEFYFSALIDEEEIFPISDEIYAQELQMQEALMSSIVESSRKQQTVSSPSSSAGSRRISSFSSKFKSVKKETGESSTSFCIICMDAQPPGEMFRNRSCGHSFCIHCISKHVAAKIQENITKVRCPEVNCESAIEPEACRSIIPPEVLNRWEDALCESLILGAEKLYCPFRDCSALLVDDGGGIVTASECPSCRRLFCAQCKVPWHSGVDCREFQALSKDERGMGDLMLMELAKHKKWRRCPNCKFFVEKTEGCLHIACRCGYHFCYGCGSSNTGSSHACPSPL